MATTKILDGPTAENLRIWLGMNIPADRHDWALGRIVAMLKSDPDLIKDCYDWGVILNLGTP